LGKNINNIKNETEIPLQVSKEIGLKVSTDKTKYMHMTCDQNHKLSCNINV